MRSARSRLFLPAMILCILLFTVTAFSLDAVLVAQYLAGWNVCLGKLT